MVREENNVAPYFVKAAREYFEFEAHTLVMGMKRFYFGHCPDESFRNAVGNFATSIMIAWLDKDYKGYFDDQLIMYMDKDKDAIQLLFTLDGVKMHLDHTNVFDNEKCAAIFMKHFKKFNQDFHEFIGKEISKLPEFKK